DSRAKLFHYTTLFRSWTDGTVSEHDRWRTSFEAAGRAVEGLQSRHGRSGQRHAAPRALAHRICGAGAALPQRPGAAAAHRPADRSEEHTSELQSREKI